MSALAADVCRVPYSCLTTEGLCCVASCQHSAVTKATGTAAASRLLRRLEPEGRGLPDLRTSQSLYLVAD